MRPGMASDPLQDLPLVHRLALAYAPARAREATLTLMLLDERLAGILRQKSEIIIAQIKLAWWRDRFGEDPAQWPAGEPLLARLSRWAGDTRELAALVDGWEALLAETFGEAQVGQFAQGKARLWRALAAGIGAGDAAEETGRAAAEWAIADLALNLRGGEDGAVAIEYAQRQVWRKPRLPRTLRPLAVLHGLAARALARGSTDLLDGPGASLAALRIGLSGR